MNKYPYTLMCQYENLYQAHLQARKGKRGKEEVIEFYINSYWHLARLQEELAKGYFLKCDISKYFNNIDHNILYETLCNTGKFDKKTLWLIRRIIESYETTSGKGLPLGNQTSQWFALFYLDKLDRIAKEQLRIKFYTRYMDDIVLIHKDKDYLKKCLEIMTKHITEERLLTFNKKTQIAPLKQGIDYLGFHFYLTDSGKVIKRLRTSNKKRLKIRIKYLSKAYASGEKILEDIKKSIAGYYGHLKHGNTYRLRKYISRKLILKKGNYNEQR